MPNMVDKFVAGAGSSYSVGATGGADSVTLDTTQIPSHNHTGTDSGHTHSEKSAYPGRQTSGGGALDGAQEYSTTTGTGFANITISNTGGGLAHENRPPYFALIYLMRII